jgi:hypothetical protein
MTNETLGWIISIALLAGTVLLRALLFSLSERRSR